VIPGLLGSTAGARTVRAAVKLLRIDTPLMWRMAAHGVVLVLSIGVFLVTRYSLPIAVEASSSEARLANWADRMGRQALDYLPSPVLGTDRTSVAASAAGGLASDAPGFISTGVQAEADPSLLPWDEPQTYIVEEGDTITGIAAAYGIEPETLLYANPDLRQNPHYVTIGQAVTILPVNGVMHVVEEGDTLDGIAETYEASIDDIVAYTPNGLEPGDELVPGAEIVVPGGHMEIEIPSYYQLVQGSSGHNVWAPGSSGVGPAVGTGAFYPATYGRFTQGFSRWHRGVDVANRTGTPIYAVDGGTVRVAGWYSWAGNAVVIDHGNGFESLYAHLSGVNVASGQQVQRGQLIGALGCTYGRGGRCTGPHLHLELYYNGAAVNPCNYGACP
jgi:LysM repeat protein